ncbi:ExeM/NucH family extracellular endonuclease [Methyloversatilis thermotolerans]|uniref:ExeM/NucH family extracellular endonuclease n=1 Tax=Methyloversatilis thermotolerans TaxID=1346290 RepID=UPI000381491C|nr:ExeM/NucH family extracellular endonuclease [Methyloversatilis thermotolerans]
MSLKPPACHLALAIAVASLFAVPAQADLVAQSLPYSQDWSNTALIGSNDNWDAVPGIMGYRGDDLTSATGTDPQTLLAEGGGVIDVNVNQSAPNTYTTGGVAEFQLADPVVALNGSGTADAPFLLLSLNTTGHSGITVRYDLRDLDGSADNAVQQVALQYRIGASGAFTNVPAAYVADATEGPSLSGKVTPVSVTLPAAADNQALLQLRIITTNAPGNDEWVGVDNIVIASGSGGGVNASILTTCPALNLTQGEAGSVTVSASDADSRVNALSLTSTLPAGFSLDALQPAAADGETASATLNVSASAAAGSYAIGLRFANDDAQSADCTANVTIGAAAAITRIPTIQGSGDASPLAGQTVTTEGVVSAVFPGLSGFYLQDEAGDGDAATSDGIFVYAPSTAVDVGQRLRLTASVTEFNTVTELVSPSALQVLGSATIQPTDIVLPESVEGELERYEGMLVRIVTPLTVSQNYFQGRYGQVTLSADGRLEIPTNRHAAGSAGALALRDENARRRIVLDDGSSAQNPNPIPFIGADNTLRAGDTVQMLTGVIDHGLITASSDGPRDYKIHPVVTPVFERSNPRSATPASVGGNVKVASFNVLNYFTTIDQSGASCYPSGTRSDCRGADSAEEFTRQRAKIVAALRALDADVVGLMEIENNGQVAVQNLVNALNSAAGAQIYAAVGAPTGGSGTDAIRVAMIYKPGKLSLVGSAVSDTAAIHNRPPLAQTFAAANGERFSVVVNHFKSKSCGDASGSNADLGDGQGCWNALRVQQAQALNGFVQQLATRTGAGVIALGDFNAYAKEDPINALVAGGMVDLSAGIPLRYTYTFDGESGQLDHALATSAIAARVSAVGEWHINTDEPFVIDYNTEYKPQDLYAATPYRSSDHDPVLIGLSLFKPLDGTAGRDALTGTAGDDEMYGGLGADTLTGGAGNDRFIYRSLRDGVDTVTDFVPGSDRIVLDELLASLGLSASTAWASGHVTLVDSAAGLSVQIDTDGSAGAGVPRALVVLRGVTAARIDVARDLGL